MKDEKEQWVWDWEKFSDIDETVVLDARAKLLRFHMPGSAPPKCQTVKAKKRGLLHSFGTCCETAIFGVQTWTIGLSRPRAREGERGKICIIKQFQSQVCSSGSLSGSCFGRGSVSCYPGFLVNWQVVHPEELLLLGGISVPCHEDVIICLSWNPKWLQGDSRENGSEQRQIQNEGEMSCFSPTFS
jgi:hypothetical protein